MSRLGKTPIPLPKGVEIKAETNGKVSIKGPNGQVEVKLPIGLTLKIDESEMFIICNEKQVQKKGFWGALPVTPK